MESKEVSFNKECGGSGVGNSSKGGEGFIDRSKVRILLCDNDAKSLEEISTLLLKCSYQGIYKYIASLSFIFWLNYII
jgi:pseudo-response regulator 1